ncbi:MAG: hypothetical protein EOO91_03305 [Pedobacter sp.]|nr:MAG: hypothetical protein EOO91_03305 [Pedobacter sp.]
MKKIILIIFLGFTTEFGYAQFRQDTTIVYANPGYNKDPMRSKWSSKVQQKGDFWEVGLYDKKDNLREKINFEDKKLEVRKGPYAFYENGKVKEEGQYDKGHKNGIWQRFYPNGQLFERLNYWYGKLAGPFTSFWDNGKLKIEGKYSNDKKIGLWEYYYSNAKLALRESYGEDGKVIDFFYFDSAGNKIPDKTVVVKID